MRSQATLVSPIVFLSVCANCGVLVEKDTPGRGYALKYQSTVLDLAHVEEASSLVSIWSTRFY